MSASVPEENDELARVLNRINTLVGKADLQERPAAADIPQLTEVYEGESLLFAARSAAEFSALDKTAGNKGIADRTELPRPETVETLLAEMLPVIQDIIRKAVLQQLEDSEQPLRAKLEMEIMQALRENLQSRLS